MRIKQISVEGLFGTFNHVIPLNREERITIIHGPNGYGKTAVMRMLNSLFSTRYSELRRTPFKEFRVDFEDNNFLCVTKKDGMFAEDNEKRVDISLSLEYHIKGSSNKSFVIEVGYNKIDFPLNFIEREISGIERIGTQQWYYKPTAETLTLEDVIDRFSLDLPKERNRQEPAWWQEIRENVSIFFIETQRIINISSLSKKREIVSRHIVPEPAVVTLSEELSNSIQTKLGEYARLSQSLDRTFPERLIKRIKEASSNHNSNHNIDIASHTLKSRLSDLENLRQQLQSVGLLEESNTAFHITTDLEETTNEVLSVYIEDVEQKLSVFDKIAKQLELFKKIINERFEFKQISIDREKGFVFKTNDGKILSPTNLSSGEQNELILLYTLLFRVQADSLILIDEPEISLHISWQQTFLRDLSEIVKLTELDILIATHSPSIIHDRWDLTVELKELESKKLEIIAA